MSRANSSSNKQRSPDFARKFENITLTFGPDHAVITLARPERLNALTFPMVAEIRSAVELCREHKTTRSILIRGAGKSFCAGDNLKGMGPTRNPNDTYARIRDESYFSVVQALRRLEKPVITAASGYAMGAGLELFLAGDIRLVIRDAKLGIPFAKLGIPGATYELPRLVGLTRAAAMLFSGDAISGVVAERYGLATEAVASSAALESRIAYWIELLANRSTRSIGLMKRGLYQCFQLQPEEALHISALGFMTAIASGDRDRGVAAWRQDKKRTKR